MANAMQEARQAWERWLSSEAVDADTRQKLQAIRPHNLGQASRVSGVSPADVAVLMVWLKRRRDAVEANDTREREQP